MKTDEQLNLVFSALSDPTRRGILSRLAQGPSSVGDLAEPFRMSAPAVSRHLKVLEHAGLISRTTRAQWRTITLQTEALDDVAAWIDTQRREWNQRFDALDAHLESMKDDTMKEQTDDHWEDPRVHDQPNIRRAP
ncbi:MAG: ArsR/SmtB family transcription factor [Mycobacteriaceae bacterium]|uniref:ArsR/SmtB family transcription factor n=1 Tax=Corynebacterium sp. TaxID=1720 RepID=UPI003F9D4FA8